MKRNLAFLLTLALSFGAISGLQTQTTYAAVADEMRIDVVQRNVTPIKLQGTMQFITLYDEEEEDYEYYNQNKLVSVKATVDGTEYVGEVADNGKDFSIAYDAVNYGTKVALEATDVHGCILKKTYTIKNQEFKLKVNTVYYSDTAITGETTPNAKMTVFIGDSDKSYTAKADNNGNFKVKIPKQKIGTEIFVGAVSPDEFNTAQTITVKQQATTLTIKNMYNGGSKVSGSVTKLKKGDYIKIKAGKKEYTVKIKKDAKKYTINQTVPTLHTGDKVIVTVYNAQKQKRTSLSTKVFLSHNIKIGMTPSQVKSTDWGAPVDVYTYKDSYCTGESWYYYDMFGHRVTLVFFYNGKVESITYSN